MKIGNQFRRTAKGRDFVVSLILLVAIKTGAAGNLIQPVSIVNSPSVVAPAGGGGDSLSPIITPDGRYVLFASSANNLVLNPSANPAPVTMPPVMNIYIRDRLKQTTTLVSVSLDGTGMGNGDSIPAGISTNGQFALFESAANNLVAGDANGVNDIFVRDLIANVTTLVSVSTNGTPANGTSRSPGHDSRRAICGIRERRQQSGARRHQRHIQYFRTRPAVGHDDIGQSRRHAIFERKQFGDASHHTRWPICGLLQYGDESRGRRHEFG